MNNNVSTSATSGRAINVSSQVRDLSIMAMFTAIVLIMAFTPFGIIDLPLIKATILHVPVVIGAIVLGPKKGAFLGFLFGATSLFKNITAPSLILCIHTDSSGSRSRPRFTLGSVYMFRSTYSCGCYSMASLQGRYKGSSKDE